jgi:hypothetical protein
LLLGLGLKISKKSTKARRAKKEDTFLSSFFFQAHLNENFLKIVRLKHNQKTMLTDLNEVDVHGRQRIVSPDRRHPWQWR